MSRRRLLFGFFAACLTMTGCEKASTPLAYSSPPGTVDLKPTHPWGEERYPNIPPQPDGHPFDPTDGKGVRRFADELIGKRVATFVTLGWSFTAYSVDFNRFFPVPEAGPGPGLCKARQYAISSAYSASARKMIKAGDGEWVPDVYAVAGSVSPMSGDWPSGYKSSLTRACQQRRDMDMWYSAEPQNAYHGALLADAIINAARGGAKLPFTLRCTPFSPGEPSKPQCHDDVRKSVASIDPRAIIEVRQCDAPAPTKCLAVAFAKKPDRDTPIEDRWSLDIFFRGDQAPQIERVEVDDEFVLFD